MSRALSSRLMHAVFSKINQKRAWYEMPTVNLKALNLLSLRLDLRDFNLFDTGTPIRTHGLEEPPPEVLTARQPDGRWNDLEDPEMGSTGTAFTRNSASNNGGGLANQSGGTATVSGSSFTSNSAGIYGGGIFNIGTLTQSGNTFTGKSPDDVS